MITDDELRQILPALPQDRRQQLLPNLQSALTEFGITTRLREAHFIAQIAHESMGLTRFVENLNYSARRLRQVFPRRFPTDASAAAVANQPEKIGNVIYANRLGNGPPASGDGFRYRGRGVIQLTGRDNYRRFGQILGLDLEGNPDQVATPEVAFRTAGAFWKSNGCNELADRDDIVAVTKRINGGTIGLDDRRQLCNRAKQVLKDEPAATRGVGLLSRAASAVGLGGATTEERDVPPNLSRGIMPGAPGAEGGGAEEKESGGAKKQPAKKAAKKSGAKKSPAKKSAAKKGGAKKGGAKKTTAGKSAAGKGAKKGGGKKGGKKGGGKKGGKKGGRK